MQVVLETIFDNVRIRDILWVAKAIAPILKTICMCQNEAVKSSCEGGI
jgi:hypothetical protein